MKDFEEYQQRSKQIAEKARVSGDTMGTVIPWLMLLETQKLNAGQRT